MPPRQQLTPLEVASGVILGPGTSAEPLAPRPEAEPLEMLERATLGALQRPPCLVAFSGGRDSSIVLAAATRTARREGLPLPIPTTERYPNAPETDESDWQDLVIRWLKLPEWHRREVIGDEQDLLGPVSTSALLKHGLLWPPNSYTWVPMLAGARGGTLLDGIDGDTLFEGWGWARPLAALSGQVRRQPRDVLRVANAFAPSAVRRWRARRGALQLPWLSSGAQAALDRARVCERIAEPRRFAKWVGWWRRMRYLELLCDAQRVLADDAEVRIVHPLLDESFLAVLAQRGGFSGFGTRTDAMRTLFEGLLPDELLARRDKAGYDTALWGRRTREFTDGWDGGGIDHEFVDAGRLRETWATESPHFRSAMLVQSLWLAEASPAEGQVKTIIKGALK